MRKPYQQKIYGKRKENKNKSRRTSCVPRYVEFDQNMNMAFVTGDGNMGVLKNHLWVADSAATCHMGNIPVYNKTSRHTNTNVQVGDGSKISSTIKGDLHLLYDDKNTSFKMHITLKEYIYSPGMKYNFLAFHMH